MAKTPVEEIKKATDESVDPEVTAAAEPFVEKRPWQPAFATPAQHAWMQAHPDYTRSSHHYGRMINRGTLYADGAFIPEAQHPVMDGPGCFGVGVALSR